MEELYETLEDAEAAEAVQSLETGETAGDLPAPPAGPVKKSKHINWKEQLTLHSMLLPGVALAVIFMIVPMIGIVMAFEKYNVALGFFGSPWVGFRNFHDLFNRPDFWNATRNTVIIAFWKIVFTSALSIVLSLLINEIRVHLIKKAVQTVLFLPYFLSWALLGNIMVDLFSYSGAFNYFLSWFGIEPVYFITSNRWFRVIVVASDVWKTIGYQIVVFLAAITNIDPALYEAAKIDGANHTQLCLHITLPGIMSMIVLMSILNIGNIMNAGFEQILVMYNLSVYETGDILDTMAYRIGLLQVGQYHMGTAIGLFKSVISCAFFSFSYFLAYKVKGYRIF